VRKHRGIALTDAGEQLFQLAAPWFDRLATFAQSVRQPERPHPVTITASIGVTSLWILPRLGAFHVTYPQIDVRVAAINRVLDIKQEGIDLAIRYCTEVNAPKGAIRLFGEEVAPVAHPAVAARAFQSRESLLDQVFLELDDRARPWLRWSEWLSACGLGDAQPRPYLYFNQYDQVIQAALEGHGVALGRLGLILPMLRDGRLVAQTDDKFGMSDFAYWMTGSNEAPRTEVQVFADWIVREAQLTAESLSGVTKRPQPVK
jgi:DNA-binding transcriptional LysR family regulator